MSPPPATRYGSDRMRRAPLLLCVALLAGCGGSGERTDTTRGYSAARGYAGATPAQAAQRYVAAFGSGDYSTACSLIARNTLAEVTQNGKFKCEDVYAKGGSKIATTQAFFKGATVSSPKVTGDNATVKVTSKAGRTIELPLVKEGGGWKVAS